jgi:hypothetical protein
MTRILSFSHDGTVHCIRIFCSDAALRLLRHRSGNRGIYVQVGVPDTEEQNRGTNGGT